MNNHLNKNNAFFYNAEYNISSRLLNDEKDHNKHLPKDSKFKFIENIKDSKKNLKNVNPKNFLKLSDTSFYNLLSFSYDFYDKIIKSSKILAFKIHSTLSNKFYKLITQFREKYKSELELLEYYFTHEVLGTNDKRGSVVNLVLKSKINSNLINKTIEINLKYKLESNKIDFFQFTWIYDKRKKGDIAYWIASEAEEVK